MRFLHAHAGLARMRIVFIAMRDETHTQGVRLRKGISRLTVNLQ